MKKIDLHIHTVATVSDSAFEFSLEVFKNYVSQSQIDAVAITNHNHFDLSQFREIQDALSAKVFPGIEIDLPSGHLLLISDDSDLAGFEAKCLSVSQRITTANDSITTADLRAIFGDLSEYLLIPHYEKAPAVRGNDFTDLEQYFLAGEVNSAKKFMRLMKDSDKLCPVLFSDSRMKVDIGGWPTRQTFIDCGEISLAAIKACLGDKNKVFLSREEGNRLFQVLDNGMHISTGLNVLLGERSSGKTYTLERLHERFDKVKYIEQFALVQSSDEEDEKGFNTDVQRTRSLFVDKYLAGLREIVEDVAKVDIEKDDKDIEKFVATLMKAADEADRRDSFSKVKLFDEAEYVIGDNEGLEQLIGSVIHVIENLEFRPNIERHVNRDSLKALAIELIETLWDKSLQNQKRSFVNRLVTDVKELLRRRTSATHVDHVNLFDIAMNKRKVSRFREIVQELRKEKEIFSETVQGFRIVATKGAFRNATEMGKAIKTRAALSDAFRVYRDPYACLQMLKGNDRIDEADMHRFFVKISYRILNKDGAEVSGGERSEFRLLQAIKDSQRFDVLLLDEPESSFDNKFLNSDVNGIIRSIADEMPVVVVTHNNNVGASIRPDYVLYARKTLEEGEVSYRVFTGYPTDRRLVCVDGTDIANHEVLLDTLEAGVEAYEDRRSVYEGIKD
ncbi:histidinol-phosphatase [Bremerella cremea]|uniref:PHP domain-containing protein n=1 Tax=Bremerella cremea TaxID=1031537 RepID=UPI0031EFD953